MLLIYESMTVSLALRKKIILKELLHTADYNAIVYKLGQFVQLPQ